MTIKKRLFISNILMVVIPFVIMFATIWASFFIFNFIWGGVPLEMIRTGRAIREAERADPNLLMFLSFAAMFAGFIIIMRLTSRMLTRHIFKRINQPLELLSAGASRFGEGNLDYKITYDSNDEFKPVCDAFNDMAARLLAYTAEIEKNEESRKELFAGISHDLRSPLTSIKAFVEGLLDGVAETPEAQREYLQIIKQKTDDINNMVSQLFLYSKMDAGGYPTYPEVLDIGREISDFIGASREEYRATGLNIELRGLPENRLVYADPIHLRSVAANILNNSAKYKTGDTANAAVYCSAENGRVRLCFEDDGPGVTDDALPKLFEVFYRGDPSRSNPRQGSGLGLATARKAVERMDGSVSAENVPGGGLRIIIEIPEYKKE